jgi:hypothetical protein
MAKRDKFLCGKCFASFATEQGCIQHATDKHHGRLVHIYERGKALDLREPSMADLMVEAQAEGMGDQIPW